MQHDGWTDSRLRFRLRLIHGSIHLNYRFSNEDYTRYFIRFSEYDLALSRQQGDKFTNDLWRIGVNHTLNRWYEIEIVGYGRNIQVYVDGELKIDFVDDDPILHGTISFETLDDSQVQIDDIGSLGTQGMHPDMVME